MKLSKSAVNSFLKCRREFKYAYVDKIKQEPNKYMKLGSDIHEVAERFVKNGGIRSKDYKEKLYEIAEDVGYTEEFDIHLNHLAEFFEEIFHNDEMKYKVFSAEDYLYDEEHNFSGLCDLVVRDENDDIIIIDYKTGKSDSIRKFRLELCYYKMLLESKYPNINIIAAGIFFTKDGKTRFLKFMDEVDKGAHCTEKDYQAAIDLLDFVRDEVKAGRFTPNRQFICRYCTYQNRCQDEGGF